MNQPQNLTPQEEALTRFIDGVDPTPQQPAWLAEQAAAVQLGNLLRSQLPARQEPPSEDFFVSQLMAKISAETPARTAPVLALPSFWQRFRVWLAPLTATAAVLVVGGVVLFKNTEEPNLAYTPDPDVKATLVFNKEAQATVINLTGLEAIPKTKNIKAYDVASSHATEPGAPQQFFAANDPEKLLFVMFPGQAGAPTIHELR